MSKHTHWRWQLDKGSWISNDVKDENRSVWVLESDYLNMKESLEAENARLKAEVERLTELNATISLRYDATKSMLDGCAKEIEEMEAEVERLTSDIQMEKENEDRLVREWQKANNEVYGLQTQVAALIDDQTRLKAEVERLTNELEKQDLLLAMANAFVTDWNAAKGVQS